MPQAADGCLIGVVPRPQTIAVERCNEPEIRVYCRIIEKFKPQISHSKWQYLSRAGAILNPKGNTTAKVSAERARLSAIG